MSENATRPGRQLSSIVHVTREYGELVGAGGLKESTQGLCEAAAAAGIATHVFLARHYRQPNLDGWVAAREPTEYKVAMPKRAWEEQFESVWVEHYQNRELRNLFVHLIGAHRYSYLSEGKELIPRRNIYVYSREEARAIGRPERTGKGYSDQPELDILLVKAALGAMERLQVFPDLIQCHDGHTALLPLIARCSREAVATRLRQTPTLTTVHNLSDWYRGEIDLKKPLATLCGVTVKTLEPCIYRGWYEPILAAGLYGTAIHTVSENYAREVQQSSIDSYNSGIGHRLAEYGVTLTGITHGIDLRRVSPENAASRFIPAAFSPADDDFTGKHVCKRRLCEEVGFESVTDKTPMIAALGRFVYQKGFAVLAAAIRQLFDEDHDVVLVGNGSGYPPAIRQIQRVLRSQFGHRIHMKYEYDRGLFNRMVAASDFCVIPSHFEPCGQIDLIAQANGSLPIVHAVGGLVKVEHLVTGFTYRGGERQLLKTLRRAIELYRTQPLRIREMQRTAARRVRDEFGWEKVFAERYLHFYADVIRKSQVSASAGTGRCRAGRSMTGGVLDNEDSWESC